MCPDHERQREHSRGNYDVRRWYRTARWKQLRRLVITEQHYQCIECGHTVLELDVDHERKHHGDPALFWDRRNLRAMCKACHSRKTAHGF